jgi:Uma2 family endonuclease
MATAPGPTWELPATHWRFNVDQYHKMGEAGIFTEDDPVELIEGVVIARRPVLAPWRFTVDDYHKMGEAGILAEDDRVELIDGEILATSPIGSRHLACVARLIDAIPPKLSGRAISSVQSSIRLGSHSEPQPDFVLLRPRADYYESALPAPSDILLLIEVMDTSAGYDRGIKLRLYASAGIREVWLADLNTAQIERCRSPRSGAYTETRVFGRGQVISPEAFADLVIAVEDIFG